MRSFGAAALSSRRLLALSALLSWISFPPLARADDSAAQASSTTVSLVATTGSVLSSGGDWDGSGRVSRPSRPAPPLVGLYAGVGASDFAFASRAGLRIEASIHSQWWARFDVEAGDEGVEDQFGFGYARHIFLGEVAVVRRFDDGSRFALGAGAAQQTVFATSLRQPITRAGIAGSLAYTFPLRHHVVYEFRGEAGQEFAGMFFVMGVGAGGR